MPIRIETADHRSSIAFLCDDDWDLANQLAALERWLGEHETELVPGTYVADIGTELTPGATGGGAAVTVHFMKALVRAGMELWISEYDTRL